MPIQISENCSLADTWELALDQISEDSKNMSLLNAWTDYFAKEVRDRARHSAPNYRIRKSKWNLSHISTWEYFYYHGKEAHHTFKDVLAGRVPSSLFCATNDVPYKKSHNRNEIALTEKNITPLIEIGKKLIINYNLDIAPIPILCWIMFDDYAVYLLVRKSGITYSTVPELFEALINNFTGEGFDIEKYRSLYKSAKIVAADDFKDFVENYESYKESDEIEEAFGFNRRTDKLSIYQLIIKAYTSETYNDDVAHLVNTFQDIHEKVGCLDLEISTFTTPLGPWVNRIHDDCLTDDGKRLHSWWNRLLSEGKDSDPEKWAGLISKRYFLQVEAALSRIECSDIGEYLEIRKEMSKSSDFRRVKDYLDGVDRKNCMYMATHLISKCIDVLKEIQIILLKDFSLDLNMEEIICIICGMYFEMDWVRSNLEALEFVKRNLDLDPYDNQYLSIEQQVFTMKCLLTLYRDNLASKRNPYIEEVISDFYKMNPAAKDFVTLVEENKDKLLWGGFDECMQKYADEVIAKSSY